MTAHEPGRLEAQGMAPRTGRRPGPLPLLDGNGRLPAGRDRRRMEAARGRSRVPRKPDRGRAHRWLSSRQTAPRPMAFMLVVIEQIPQRCQSLRRRARALIPGCWPPARGKGRVLTV